MLIAIYQSSFVFCFHYVSYYKFKFTLALAVVLFHIVRIYFLNYSVLRCHIWCFWCRGPSCKSAG